MTDEISRNEANATGLSFEEANLIFGEMEIVQTLEVKGNDLHIGNHPKYGRIFLIIPSLGDSILIVPADFRT